jgi:hypothetical protein
MMDYKYHAPIWMAISGLSGIVGWVTLSLLEAGTIENSLESSVVLSLLLVLIAASVTIGCLSYLTKVGEKTGETA